MRMRNRGEQTLIEPRPIQQDFAVVYATDGLGSNGKITRILDIDDDLRAAFRRHPAHRAALLGAFLDEHLEAGP